MKYEDTHTYITNLPIQDIDDLIPTIIKDCIKLTGLEISGEFIKDVNADLKKRVKYVTSSIPDHIVRTRDGYICLASYNTRLEQNRKMIYCLTWGKDIIRDNKTEWIQLYSCDYILRTDNVGIFSAYVPKQGTDYMNSLVDKAYGDDLKGLLDL